MKLPFRLPIPFALLLAASAALPACGGGGSQTSGGLSSSLALTMMDSASDQVDSFQVDVTALDLTRLNHAAFQALAAPVTLDFADLTDSGQLLNLVDAPLGNYVSASITLDFTHATCLLTGQSTPATILDDQGAALNGPIVVPVTLSGVFVLGAAAHKQIEIDLDLAQSLQIDAANNTVAFTPTFSVRTDPAQQHPIAIAGRLASIDTVHSSFVVTLKDDNGLAIANVTCGSDNATVFQTNGVPATGMTGLNALALLPLDTWVQAQGTVDVALARIDVTNVNAGIGTWNGGTDIIEGHVIDRSGAAGADATFTVLGRSSNAAHDTFQFNTSFTVTSSFAGTHVVRHASSTAYDTDEINVGQHVRIFGTLSGTAMDVTAGVLREQPTWIFGTAAGAPASGQLTLALAFVGMRDQTLYQWADGGTTPPNPSALVADVGALADALQIDVGTHVLLRGYFSGVSDAGADFTADAVTNADTAPALLLVRNILGTGFDVALTCGVAQIDITITGSAAAGEYAVIDQGLVGITSLPSAPTPTIVPAGGVGLYAIRDITAGGITTYLSFITFSASLNDRISAGAQVRHVAAIGPYDAGTNTVTASLASVVVQ